MQITVEIPLLQFFIKVVGVQVHSFHGCSRGEDSWAPLVFVTDVEKTVEIPQLQFVGLLVTCLSLCNGRCLGWLRQCRNCGCSAVGIVSWTG